MSMWYIPDMPKEEIFDRGAREVSKYMMVRLFEETMPDLKKTLQQGIGDFSVKVRESDPAIADAIDNIRLDNEAVMDIFYNSLENNKNEFEIYEQVSGDMAEGNPVDQNKVNSEAGNGSSNEEDYAQ